MNFRKTILYGNRKKATHLHQNQLRIRTFFPYLVKIGPPTPTPVRLPICPPAPGRYGTVAEALFCARPDPPPRGPVTPPTISATTHRAGVHFVPFERKYFCESNGIGCTPAGRLVVTLAPPEVWGATRKLPESYPEAGPAPQNCPSAQRDRLKIAPTSNATARQPPRRPRGTQKPLGSGHSAPAGGHPAPARSPSLLSQ